MAPHFTYIETLHVPPPHSGASRHPVQARHQLPKRLALLGHHVREQQAIRTPSRSREVARKTHATGFCTANPKSYCS